MRDAQGRFMKQPKQPGEGKLPKEWCLALTDENRDIVGKWRTCGNLGHSTGYVLSQGHSAASVKSHKGFHVNEKPKGTPEITFEQFKKYVMCLDTPPENWCIRLNTREIAEAVNSANWWKYGKLQWHDSIPYNVSYIDSNREYHSGIGTPPSGFTEITIEQFRKYALNQKEMKDKKLVGYNFKPSMKQYEPAALAIARVPHWNLTSAHVTATGSIKALSDAAVLHMWFEPVYEDTVPQVEIRGYRAVFNGNQVAFGCQVFTKDEVLKFVDILDRSGLIVATFNPEVRKVADYFRKKK